MSLVFTLLRGPLVGAFLENPIGATLAEGMQFLLIVAPCYPLLALKLVCDGILRGAGVMRYFMISTFTDLFLRVVLARVFSGLWGSVGIWMAWPVGWVISTALSAIFYYSGVWNRRSFGAK